MPANAESAPWLVWERMRDELEVLVLPQMEPLDSSRKD
jgi:hypothetical protein